MPIMFWDSWGVGLGHTDHGNTLYGLPKTHLISKDAVLVGVPGVHEPVQTLQLVVSELASCQVVRLALQSAHLLEGLPRLIH